MYFKTRKTNPNNPIAADQCLNSARPNCTNSMRLPLPGLACLPTTGGKRRGQDRQARRIASPAVPIGAWYHMADAINSIASVTRLSKWVIHAGQEQYPV